MASSPSGSLSKLSLKAYTDPKFSAVWSGGPNPIKVQINPESYSQTLGALYTSQNPAGTKGDSDAYNREKGAGLRLALLFDGTGAIPDSAADSVEQQIAELRRLCLTENPATHEPNFVVVTWGTLLFKGRLLSLDIDYTLFDPDGTPLRAKVNASFKEYQDGKDSRAEQNQGSPDLTHVIIVKAGDTLPLMCHRIYGDGGYYPQVAAANGLDGFRALKVGMALTFPPLVGARG